MCGIAGFWDFERKLNNTELTNLTQKMTDAILNRGPESAGIWTDENHGIALGHRRLAIVDLSESGHQPMHSVSNRYVISYNGEIYNAGELKKKLRSNVTFRGTSDTEILLACMEEFGIEETVKLANGMFAIALFDKVEKCLYLMRDRLGKKPLYWGMFGHSLLFGSQPKALMQHASWHGRGQINRNHLVEFLRFNYIPQSGSIFENVKQCPPATILKIDSGARLTERLYWCMQTAISHAKSNQMMISPTEATNELERLLMDAVNIRMFADVPLGAFLSGGVDSSLVAALMQKLANKPIKTFSIGFNEKNFNEANFAKTIANHLKTDHTELYLPVNDAQNLIPDIPNWFDEPFADSSQLPTYLVSRLAREKVTVALSGDGGDEFFAGYERYRFVHDIWNRLRFLPHGSGKILKLALRLLKEENINTFYNFLPISKNVSHLGTKLQKLATALDYHDAIALYDGITRQWDDPESLVIGAKNSVSFNWKSETDFIANNVEKLQYLDAKYYLPDDILTKVDRTSMAVSLEARAPLLDYRVVEYSWRLPMTMKLRGGTSKWILREILYKHVPKKLIERPKMGFGVPIDAWLRGSLKDWANELLNEKKLREQGYLNPNPIRKRLEQHFSGDFNWQHSLWGPLMFQAWLEKYKNAVTPN